MLNSIGNMALVHYREVVRFSEGPLSEAQLYMKTRVSGPGSLELALQNERKIEKWPFIEHLVLACTINLMNDLGLVK